MTNELVSHIRGRLHRLNKNMILVVTGETGSGKSYAALRLCEAVDRSFDISRCYFDVLDVVKDLRDNKLKKGQAILLDESGAAFGSREFSTLRNRKMSALLQIFRAENLFLCMTLPYKGFLDKSARMLAHGTAKTQSIDRKANKCQLYFVFNWFNERKGEVWDRLFCKVNENGIPEYMRLFKVNLPSPKLRRAYEKKKKAYLKDTYAKIAAELEPEQKQDRPSKRSMVESLLSIGKLDDVEIARAADTSIANVRNIRSDWRKSSSVPRGGLYNTRIKSD